MLKHFAKAAFAGAAMLLAALAPSAAWATNTFSASNFTQDGGTFSYTGRIFATQAVGSGALSFPTGLKYAFTNTATTVAGSFTLTITLPSGVLFSSTPTLTADGIICTGATLASGGNGSNSIAVSATVTSGHAASNVCSVTLGPFGVTGATALATNSPFSFGGGSFFQATSQVTASSGSTSPPLETAATPLQIAASGSQLVFSASGANGGSIDLAAPSFGKLFSPGSDLDFIRIGSITYGTNNYFAANGTSIFMFSATSLTFKLTGALTGLSKIFLNPNNTTDFCDTAVPPAGSILATISGGSATFSGVGTLGTQANPFLSANYGTTASGTVCVIAGGTTILSANPTGFGGSATIDTTTQNVDQSLGQLSGYSYNGSVQQINHSPNNSSYVPFIRIVNNSGYTIQVFAQVVTGAGTGNTVVESGLAPNAIDQIEVSTIVANAGLSGQASLTLFATGPGFSACTNNSSGTGCGVTMSQGLVNPNGTLVQYGSGASP